MIIKNKKIISLLLLTFLNSCIFLSKNSIIKKKESESISVISVKVIYDNKLSKKNHGPMSFCQPRFRDEEFNTVRFRNKENFEYYILRHEEGKISLENMRCLKHVIPMLYSKYRVVEFDDLAFISRANFINYAGHITIKYNPKGFTLADLFGLGGLKIDKVGKLDFQLEDKIDDAIEFFYSTYPELKNIPFTKSLMMETSKLKPNDKAEPYIKINKNLLQNSQILDNKINPAIDNNHRNKDTEMQNQIPLDKNKPQNNFIYYLPPPKPEKTPYYNPYSNSPPPEYVAPY